MKKFKKIYIEITNKCNLSCEFCPKDNLKKKDIKLEEFEEILKKINNYTEYIYLHVKGEPLIHPQFSEIIDLCLKYNKKVNKIKYNNKWNNAKTKKRRYKKNKTNKYIFAKFNKCGKISRDDRCCR